jgi:MYXO-CTERM domain-containing protein
VQSLANKKSTRPHPLLSVVICALGLLSLATTARAAGPEASLPPTPTVSSAAASTLAAGAEQPAPAPVEAVSAAAVETVETTTTESSGAATGVVATTEKSQDTSAAKASVPSPTPSGPGTVESVSREATTRIAPDRVDLDSTARGAAELPSEIRGNSTRMDAPIRDRIDLPPDRLGSIASTAIDHLAAPSPAFREAPVVGRFLEFAAATAREAVARIGGVSDLLIPAAVPLLAGQAEAPALPTAPAPTAAHLPLPQSWLLISTPLLHVDETSLTEPLSGYLGQSATSEVSRVGPPGLQRPFRVATAPWDALAHFDGRGIAGHSDERAPLDAPMPPPGSSQTAAGSSNSPFTPIVALLALLALAAAAASRRLGKGQDFRAPTPFVCALERPG